MSCAHFIAIRSWRSCLVTSRSWRIFLGFQEPTRRHLSSPVAVCYFTPTICEPLGLPAKDLNVVICNGSTDRPCQHDSQSVSAYIEPGRRDTRQNLSHSTRERGEFDLNSADQLAAVAVDPVSA